ncbi:MAG: hypothetical protein LAP61_10965 [Acidobacteriia bacterium]|nr:hypothetical protein [Terriglobia bacterium]
MIRRTITWAAPGLLLAGLLATPLASKAAETPDSEQVSKLLSEAKTMAFELKEDAVTMESFTRMNVSMQSHAVAINQIKDHINALTRQTAKLKEARSAGSPWQQTAIDRITPFLDELGGYTYAVIEHLNGDVKHTPAEYKDYLQANADYATDLAAMIADFVDFGRSKDRMQHLADKLEIPKH